MKSFSLLAAAVLFGSAVAEIKKIGCYGTVSSEAVMTNVTEKRNSMGFCGTICAQSVAFAISSFNLCYCVDEIPAASDKVDESKCNLACPAFPADNCGGTKDYIFYDSGIALSIPTASPVSSSSSSTTSTAVPSSTSSSRASLTRPPAETIIVTSSSKPTESSGSSSKPNTAGIAAGVVIGVVVIAGIMGGLFFFMKQRKKRALEEEHRRNAEVNATKPSQHVNPFNDTRLDPVMAHRRMSDGSIADNQDYSRRILKVTNA